MPLLHRPTGPLPRSRASRGTVFTALATAALVPVLLSGCSTSPDTSDGSSPRAGDTAKVGQCVRDKGYDVDDSDFVGVGTFRQPDGLSVDEADIFAQVVATCSEGTSLAIPGDPGGSNSDNDDQLLKLTACLRAAGFTDVKDPVDGVWFPDEAYENDPSYLAATDACVAEVGLEASR